MAKGVFTSNRRKLYEKVKGMQHAGKSDREISEVLAITPLTIQYLANLFRNTDSAAPGKLNLNQEQRPEVAHEMWLAGKSYAEISEMLQISISRARQIIHRHAWSLRQPDLQPSRKH